jgi:hypothetical protein
MNLADYINPECYIVLPNGKVVDKEQISVLKNFYKEEIYKKTNGKTVGKIVLIWSNNVDVILPAIQAIWELGCAISVHDFSLEIVSHPAFKNFYNHIDIIIGPPIADAVLPELPHIPALETKMSFIDYEHDQQESTIWQLDPNKYPDKEYCLDQPISGETICCVSHTSGTTGDPKIIEISHYSAIQLVKENIRIFKFSNEDRVLHHKTLHHGSLFLNYAVPGFVSTKHHNWVTQKHNESVTEFMQRCVNLCEDFHITKWLIPYRNISLLSSNSVKNSDLSKTSLITVMGPSTNELKVIFQKHHPLVVYNNFGCTEVGTIAVSETDQHTIENYDSTVFTEFNSLLDLEIHPTYFRVKYKHTSDWKKIGDIVDLSNKKLKWHGRNTYLEFDGEKIHISKIELWLRKYLNSSEFSLVPDFDRNELYLAVFNEKSVQMLNNINTEIESVGHLKKCKFSKISHIKFEEVFQGIKPSQPVLLYYFRNI